MNTLAPHGNWSSRVWTGITSLGLFQKVGDAAAGLANIIVVRPLAQLYLFGPTYLGFWGGRQPDEICSQLTGINADHWNRDDRNLEDCLVHIEKHFNSWLVLGYTALYFAVLLSLAWWLVKGRHQRPVSPPPQELTIRVADGKMKSNQADE